MDSSHRGLSQGFEECLVEFLNGAGKGNGDNLANSRATPRGWSYRGVTYISWHFSSSNRSNGRHSRHTPRYLQT